MIQEESARFRFILWAVGLYAVWTLATYVLEGRSLTLMRPEAAGARLVYALAANIGVGIIGGGLVLSAAVRNAGADPQRLALRSAGRTILSLALGIGLGFAAFVLQQPVTLAPTVIGNAFAQVWVVSMAEVLVCWAVLGKAVEIEANVGGSRWLRVLVAWLVSATGFGLYHFAHSPPFNTVAMVGLLTVVGLATGAFFFIVGELYGTILFHNFLAMKGVTAALAEGGGLEHFNTLQLPLIVTAMVATGVLISADLLVRKQAASQAASRARGLTSG
jgi:hypothetical protein